MDVKWEEVENEQKGNKEQLGDKEEVNKEQVVAAP